MAYENIAFLVTTICNRGCPECCYRIPTHETMMAHHYDWTYFEYAARFLRGIGTLYVSGGEPTLHPEFERIAREFKALFEVGSLCLITNGIRLREFDLSVLECFDQIIVTNFPFVETQKTIEWIKGSPRLLGITVLDNHWRVPASRKGNGYACNRRTIGAYAEGRLFLCCIGPGIPGAESIEPSEDWATRLATLKFPCTACSFSGINEDHPDEP